VLLSPTSIAEQADWTPVHPLEADYPFLDVDWSLGTRAAAIRDSVSGDRFETGFSPSASVTHKGKELTFSGAASGDFTKTDGGALNIDELLLSGTSSYEVDPFAKLDSNVSLSMTQEDPNAPDVAADVAETPIEYAGTAGTAYTRKFGRFNATVKLDADREVYGPTTLTDGTRIDNTDQNNTSAGTGLRLGFQLTPVLEVFADAEAARTVFDAPSATLLTKLDGDEYTLMGGVSAVWDATLSASASAGIGIDRFDNPALAEVRAALFDASLTYKPTEPLSLTGSFTTTLGAPGPNGAGTARIDYEADAAATYLVNDWLDWRGSVGWHDTRYADATTTDTGYGFGIGADYIVNRHVKLSADYGYAYDQITPNPATNTQTVSIGMTVEK
jgi:hypothetical protein